MRLYVWNRIDDATDNYHSEGGVLVIAESIERAREMIDVKMAPRLCSARTVPPDLDRSCEGPEVIEIYPDSGCC